MDSWTNHAYEVVLAPAAVRTIRGLPSADARELAAALAKELENGPNAVREVRFDSRIWKASRRGGSGDVIYTATPLSYHGHTVIHRPMTSAELERLGEQQARLTARRGFYVIDILPAETAFRHWPRLAPP